MIELDLSEGHSSGIPTIQEELEKNGSPRAEFFTDKDRRAMRIRIPIHPVFLEEKENVIEISVNIAYVLRMNWQSSMRRKIMEISKKDWKLFREKLAIWQENYMNKLTKEYIELLNDENKNASDKFWELEKRIKKDRKHPGVIMEMSKSEAMWNIVYLIRLGVIEYDDLADFTDDLKLAVKDVIRL